MGSTGEADRKRRHVAAMFPTAAAAKQAVVPLSEDKKLNKAILQFQNQKLCQKLEAQKIEIQSLEDKFELRREKQNQYGKTLASVSRSWEELVDDLESSLLRTRRSSCDKRTSVVDDDVLSSADAVFLSRLMETGATECSSLNEAPQHMIENQDLCRKKCRSILDNIVASVDEIWCLKDGLYSSLSMAIPENGSYGKSTSNDVVHDVKNLRLAFNDLHLKQRAATKEVCEHQDNSIKNNAELKWLRGELESVGEELHESNQKVAALKAEKEATKGGFFLDMNHGSRSVADERAVDKQKEVQDMESAVKELMDSSSSRLLELKRLHEERIGILKKLADLQCVLKSVKSISSSQASQLVREQLEKSKAEFLRYRDLFEKLQVGEKDNLPWREREANILNELGDLYGRTSFVAESRINELGVEIQKQIDERHMIETKILDSLREPGRKEIISKFKVLASSFPENMNAMQSQLSKYKETAKGIHSLRANVQSLTNVLSRKRTELESLSTKCSEQEVDLQRLQTFAQDLKDNEMELELFLEMYRRESTFSRVISEARDSEYRAWAHVHRLKSSLEEHNLVHRVKESIEAEALSQQRSAVAEAEIADLRTKCEVSKREKSKLNDALKTKIDENDAFLSEIETIGQEYDDLRNQNHHLLQQITERDDYNIKLFVEGARGRQMSCIMHKENQLLGKKIQQATISGDLFDAKATRIEEQVKIYAEQVQRLAEERCQTSLTLENIERRLLDARRSSLQGRESLEALQLRVKDGRANLAGLQVDLETERFEKRRLQEDLEAARVKAAHLTVQRETSTAGKLRQELLSYRELVKCSICLDGAKEVVITKCYHLFCNQCVQRLIESRHRKCPICATTFGRNDVKTVYI
ncbi:E3 ubiquitin-protein ligase BRE1-like 1-like protein [Drosera capensis]